MLLRIETAKLVLSPAPVKESSLLTKMSTHPVEASQGRKRKESRERGRERELEREKVQEEKSTSILVAAAIPSVKTGSKMEKRKLGKVIEVKAKNTNRESREKTRGKSKER